MSSPGIENLKNGIETPAHERNKNYDLLFIYAISNVFSTNLRVFFVILD